MMTRVWQAAVRGATRWWPLAIPFALGLASVLLSIQQVIAAGNDGTTLEGALVLMALAGFASLGLLAWTLAAAVAVQRRHQRPFFEFVLVLFAATLPVAWNQCLNMQGSLMPDLWDRWHQSSTISPAETALWNTSAYIVLFIVAASAAYGLARIGATPEPGARRR
ncbi:MAG: hypothetical protein ABSD03_07975 [Vulcanimicrobiaceae bacterium]|jgi:hypothetical protein